MRKKVELKVGQIYAIPLYDSSYTIAQLIYNHIISIRCSSCTFSFFDYQYNSIDEVQNDLNNIDLSEPYAVATTNSNPKDYCWELVGARETVNTHRFINNISMSTGNYNKCSIDPLLFIEPFFGLFPWDGYAIDNYLEDRCILPGIEIPKRAKYMKDYSTVELLEIMPKDSLKLQQRLLDDGIDINDI